MRQNIDHIVFQGQIPSELYSSDRIDFYNTVHSQAKTNIYSQLQLYDTLKANGYCKDKNLLHSLYREFSLSSICLQNVNNKLLEIDDAYKQTKKSPIRSILILSVIAVVAFFVDAIFLSGIGEKTILTETLITNFLVTISSVFLFAIITLVNVSYRISKLEYLENSLSSNSCLKGIETSCKFINLLLMNEIKVNVVENPYPNDEAIDFGYENDFGRENDFDDYRFDDYE